MASKRTSQASQRTRAVGIPHIHVFHRIVSIFVLDVSWFASWVWWTSSHTGRVERIETHIRTSSCHVPLPTSFVSWRVRVHHDDTCLVEAAPQPSRIRDTCTWEMERQHAQIEQLVNERKQIQVRIRVLEELRRDADMELARVDCALALAKERRKRNQQQQEVQRLEKEHVRRTIQQWENERMDTEKIKPDEISDTQQQQFGGNPRNPHQPSCSVALSHRHNPSTAPQRDQQHIAVHYVKYRGPQLESLPTDQSLLAPHHREHDNPLDAMRSNCRWLDPFRSVSMEEIHECACKTGPCQNQALPSTPMLELNKGQVPEEKASFLPKPAQRGPHKRIKVIAKLHPRGHQANGAAAAGGVENNARPGNHSLQEGCRGRTGKDKSQGMRYFRGDIFDPLARSTD